MPVTSASWTRWQAPSRPHLRSYTRATWLTPLNGQKDNRMDVCLCNEYAKKYWVPPKSHQKGRLAGALTLTEKLWNVSMNIADTEMVSCRGIQTKHINPQGCIYPAASWTAEIARRAGRFASAPHLPSSCPPKCLFIFLISYQYSLAC